MAVGIASFGTSVPATVMIIGGVFGAGSAALFAGSAVADVVEKSEAGVLTTQDVVVDTLTFASSFAGVGSITLGKVATSTALKASNLPRLAKLGEQAFVGVTLGADLGGFAILLEDTPEQLAAIGRMRGSEQDRNLARARLIGLTLLAGSMVLLSVRGMPRSDPAYSGGTLPLDVGPDGVPIVRPLVPGASTMTGSVDDLARELTPEVFSQLTKELGQAVLEDLSGRVAAPALRELTTEVGAAGIKKLVDELGPELVETCVKELGGQQFGQFARQLTDTELKDVITLLGVRAVTGTIKEVGVDVYVAFVKQGGAALTRRIVLSADVGLRYGRGAIGDSVAADALADLIRRRTAETATELRRLKDIATNQGLTAAQAAADLSPIMSAAAKGNIDLFLRNTNPRFLHTYFGRALQFAMEPGLRTAAEASGALFRPRGGGVIPLEPDIVLPLGGGRFAVLDWTSAALAGKAVTKYGVDVVDVIIEIIHTGA